MQMSEHLLTIIRLTNFMNESNIYSEGTVDYFWQALGVVGKIVNKIKLYWVWWAEILTFVIAKNILLNMQSL